MKKINIKNDRYENNDILWTSFYIKICEYVDENHLRKRCRGKRKKDEEKVIAIAKGLLVISMTVARKCLMCTYVMFTALNASFIH